MNHIAQLQAVLELSQLLLRQAEKGEFLELVEMEGRRQELIDQCFAVPVPAEAAEGVAATIRRVLDINDQIAEICRQHEGFLANALADMHHSRKALRAYTEPE